MTELEVPAPLYTIGHSTLSAEQFFEILARHKIEVLLDVRSQPYSRYVPQFNREGLEGALSEASIRYQFLGREFGARSLDPNAYSEDGRVQYSAIRATNAFEQRLIEVSKAAEVGQRQALLCTEADPADCHRAVLVAHAFSESGIRVVHIHSDGRVEEHQDFLERVSGPPDLFSSSDEERFARALAQRERAIAYVNPDLSSAADRRF